MFLVLSTHLLGLLLGLARLLLYHDIYTSAYCFLLISRRQRNHPPPLSHLPQDREREEEEGNCLPTAKRMRNVIFTWYIQ